MAAGLYLLVIWAHLSLAGGTAFAIFYAFAMSAMLVYWTDQSALKHGDADSLIACLLYTSPSPRDQRGSRMPSSA